MNYRGGVGENFSFLLGGKICVFVNYFCIFAR